MSNRCEKWSKIEFKQFSCFIFLTYGITFLLWPCRLFAEFYGEYAYLFSQVMVLIPALGAMTAVRSTVEEANILPQKYYSFFCVVAFVSLGVAISAVIVPEYAWAEFSTVIRQIMALMGWGVLLFEDKQCRKKYGLSWNRASTKVSIGIIGLFYILYFSRIFVLLLICEEVNSLQQIILDKSFALVYLFQLLPYFFFSYLSYFGEEYGWRFFFQPLMQKRFGNRIGVILVGVLWGIWHIPMVLVPSNSGPWMLIALTQCIGCMCFGSFLGWAYMKTNNVWLVVFLHYLSNQFALLFIPITRIGVLDVNSLSQIGVLLIVNVCYCAPLFLEFKSKKKDNS